jgi:hypoxanthine phosphoribosyltransferase
MIPSRDRIVPMLSEVQIQARILEMGAQISADYTGKDVVVVGLLNGVYPFFADLTRAIQLDFDIGFMQVSSYHGGPESTGEVKIVKDREPLSLKVCTLLDKPSRRKTQVPVDYIGFTIEDRFVVGYGLDLDGKFRNLPYVGIYQP